MAGGIGDFSVSAGKEGAAGRHPDPGPSTRTGTPAVPAELPRDARLHYVILAGAAWPQPAPLRFHNGHLDELRGRLTLATRVPLPDMPGFFPPGSEGEMRFEGRHVFRLDAALREQPLLSHLEALRALIHRCAARRVAYPDFLLEINRIPIPAEWRNEIVNGLFRHAEAPGAAPAQPPRGQVSRDLDRLLALVGDPPGSAPSTDPSLARFLEEVGRDSTGFILDGAAAKTLEGELASALQALRGGLLRHGPLAEALALLASLQRLAKAARGRERQAVHIWTDIPSDPGSLLVADGDGSSPDIVAALVLVDPLAREPAFLRRAAALAASLGAPLLLQLPGESLPADHEGVAALRDALGPHAAHAYWMAGGVAVQAGEDAAVFRPAALAFLEGLVAGRESVSFYLHRAMKLEDQDLVTEKGQARAADALLDQSRIDALSAARINRVNGARNRAEAGFPLLRPWQDA